MSLDVLVVLAAIAGLCLVATRVSGPTVNTLTGLFRAPELGWPSGVQEDDDLHWSWAKTGARTPRRGVEPEAGWQELDPATVGLPVRPLLRHGRG
jgi:hypothetical protein